MVMALGLGTAYGTLFAVAWRGRTIGRRLFDLYLVDSQGAPPTPARAMARSFVALISFALFLGGFWMALFDPKGQTLHDKLCSTFVVRLGATRT